MFWSKMGRLDDSALDKIIDCKYEVYHDVNADGDKQFTHLAFGRKRRK